MNKKEKKKPGESKQKVIDCLGKFSNANAEIISRITGINKLLVYKIVKSLSTEGMVKINSEVSPPRYSLVKTSSKNQKSATNNASQVPVKKKTPNDEVVLKVGKRNTDKLKFEGEFYGKGRLALAVLRRYVNDHPRTSIAKLKEIFPDALQPRYGFFQTVEKARKMSVDRERFFLKAGDILTVEGKKIACTNQFGAHNLPLKHFRTLGYSIK